MDKIKKSRHSTQKAAKKFNRRTAIKRGAAVAAFAGVAPMFVKNAFAASSGEVNVVMWGEYLPDSVVADFLSQENPSNSRVAMETLVTTNKVINPNKTIKSSIKPKTNI